MGNVRWRLASWVMACALLPSVLSMGHWGFSFDLPGYGGRAAAAPAGEPVYPGSGQHHDGAEDGHERHCHGDAASCSDVPLAGASAFAILKELAFGLCAASTGVLGAGTVAVLIALCSQCPETRPPRSRNTALHVLVPQAGGLR